MVPDTWIYNLLFILFLSFSAFSQTISGKAKIIDGDTIHIGSNKIRLHGIDAPEFNQNCKKQNINWSCGKDSTYVLVNLINNQYDCWNGK